MPKMMTQRAMHMINISATNSVYHVTIFARLQHKIMEVISSNNVAKRDQYGLPELLADSWTFFQKSANLTASLANDSELVTASVGLPAQEDAPLGPPYRQATPSVGTQDRGRSRTPPGTVLRDNTAHNARSPSHGRATPTDDTERKCKYCPVIEPWWPGKQWAEHSKTCAGIQERLRNARAQFPGTCTVCKWAKDRCTCNRDD